MDKMEQEREKVAMSGHGVSNHWQLDPFAQELVHVKNKSATNALPYWPFVEGIHQRQVDSHYKSH